MSDSSDLTIGIFDCDTHCYEKRDAFTKYMPKDLLDRSIFPVRLPDGTETDPRRPPRRGVQQRAGTGLRPGVPPGLAEGDAQADGVGQSRRDLRTDADAPGVPGAGGADASCSKQQGVDRCVLYPSTMALSVEQYVTDTPIAYANIHSFNRWFDETWDFDGDRISPTALLSFRDLDRSVAELEDILGPWRARRPVPDRARARALARRPVLRPDLGAARGSRRGRRVPHHGALVQRAHRVRRGATSRCRHPGTCRRGSGRTPTASGRSRTRSRR